MTDRMTKYIHYTKLAARCFRQSEWNINLCFEVDNPSLFNKYMAPLKRNNHGYWMSCGSQGIRCLKERNQVRGYLALLWYELEKELLND
jgi:hypothetical protein